MHPHRRNLLMSCGMLAVALLLLDSCNSTSTVTQAAGFPMDGNSEPPRLSVLSGTRINVALGGNVASETAHAGDAWRGLVTEGVRTQSGGLIPAGSPVEGVVADAIAGSRGVPAMLELSVRSIRINGHDELIDAGAGPVLAGSARARNLGAITASSARRQVVLSDGTVMSFTVRRTAAIH